MIKKLVFIVIVLCIGLGIWSSNNLTYNFNTDPLTFSTNAEKQQYLEYTNAFSVDKDGITIGLEKKDTFATYQDFLEVQKLTKRIDSIKGVEKVVSIENIKIPRQEGLFVVESHFLPLSSESKFQKKFNKLNAYRDIGIKFLSEDNTALSFYVFLDEDNLNTSQTINDIKATLRKAPFDNFHILGAPVFEAEGNEILEKETLWMTLLGCILMLVSITILLPSFKRIALTILFSGFNVCVTLLCMYLLHIEITTFTSAIPSIITILSFTDITHIIYHYDQLNTKNLSLKDINKKLFKVIGMPLILTSASNLIGFIIFYFNGGISQITDLAVIATIGIIFAYFSSRFILPIFLNNTTSKKLNNRYQKVEIIISKCVDIVSLNYKKVIFIFSAFSILLIVFIAYTSKINMHYYEKDNTALAINRACTFYDTHFQGIRDIEVVLNSNNDILNEANIKVIDSIENYLINKYGCKSTFSINTITKRYQRFKKRGNPNGFVIPKKLTKSFINNLKQKEETLGVMSVISKDSKTTRVVGSLPDIGTHEALALNKDLEQFLAKHKSDSLEIYVNGKAYLFDQNVFNLTKFVLIALVIGIILIGIFSGLLFKSIWIGFTTLIANLLPLLFGVLMMSLLNIDLNPGSVFILTILLGVALDDSIYILGHYYKSTKIKGQNTTTLINSLKSNSLPLFVTSIVLSVSFLALSVSSYHFLFSFGIIVSASLIFAFISDMFFMPALLIWGINKSNK
ncbi:efflux RND transporter permease subunit [Pontimicrobium sp. IMCC45349]|uniref:efflux RND transporter permease subunit n=1 Tax=Pontimicrobium sp. IMCC45349 TaxID=3391574 RepID=UPI00399F7B4A